MRAPRPVLVALVATSLGATAFAPGLAASDAAASGAALDPAVDTLATLVTDDDPATQQPVVLIVGDDGDGAEAAYDAQTVPGRFAFAEVELGCGDAGGPQDRAALVAIADALRADERTTDALALHAIERESGHQALSAATSPEGADAFAAVITETAILDPYDVLFSEGGVRRRVGPLGVEPTTLACTPEGATLDGTRDEVWDDRDVTERIGSGDAALFIQHHNTGTLPVAHTLAIATSLDASRGDVLDAANSHDGDRDEIEAFLALHLLGVGDGPELRYAASGMTFETDCVVAACLGLVATAAGSSQFPAAPSTVSLFLNRTFEQDLDCTPACVPGPGTGEIGTLEQTNRFEAPWAPVFTWLDAGANSSRVTEDDPLNEGAGLGGDESLPGGHGYHSLAFHSDTIAESGIQIRGQARVEGWFDTGRVGGTITPLLVAVPPRSQEGVPESGVTLTTGALDLDLAADRGETAHVAGWKRGEVVMDAIDVHVPEGWRLMVVLQSSDVERYSPGTPQGTVNVATGPLDGVTTTGTLLHLPVARGSFVG